MLRWPGSKRPLLSQLLSRIDWKHNRYFEPFAGSACLFFAAKPSMAVLGDLNRELIETYMAVRDHPRLVSRAMRQWPIAKGPYYRVRALSAENLTRIDRAARFIYLNRLCFNGVYRTNRRGEFNVPYGTNTGRLPTEAHLYRCSVALRSAELRAGDFESTVADAGPGDVIYLDPPYTAAPSVAYGLFGYGSFVAADLNRAVWCLEALDARGVSFLFSYAAEPALISRLPKRWTVEHVSTRGQIAASLDSRTARPEVLIANRLGEGAS